MFNYFTSGYFKICNNYSLLEIKSNSIGLNFFNLKCYRVLTLLLLLLLVNSWCYVFAFCCYSFMSSLYDRFHFGGLIFTINYL